MLSPSSAPRFGWPGVIALFALLFAPAPADAHIHSGAVATHFRASVSPLGSSLDSALTARIYESDLAFGLSVQQGHRVIVLGYGGEPFLRLDSAGVAVNETSSTGAMVGLIEETRTIAREDPVWRTLSGGTAVVWHDERIRDLPPGVERRQWRVPLVVDGSPAELEGEIRRVHAPSLRPWLGLGALFAAMTVLVLLGRRRLVIRRVAVACGALAAAATIAIAVGFAVDPNASTGSWVEGVNEIVLACAGVGVLALGSQDARAISAGLLGLLGIFAGLLKLDALTHGVVLSALPAEAARVAVAIAILAGFAAMALAPFSVESTFGTSERAPGRGH